jgi:hypothetical protein
MPDAPSRGQLVEKLAGSFHRARMQQGNSPEPDHVTTRDRENAEATVAQLQELGVYKPSGLSAALRHPVVAGVLLAFFTGVFASVLVPALTRSWQDRPKELALKRELVARLSREATIAAEAATDGANQQDENLATARKRWTLQSAILASELGTYFPDTNLEKHWRNYSGMMDVLFETAERTHDPYARLEEGIQRYWLDLIKDLRFDDQLKDQRRSEVVRAAPEMRLTFGEVRYLMLADRDQVASEIIDTEASGFSHGFWIFGLIPGRGVKE